MPVETWRIKMLFLIVYLPVLIKRIGILPFAKAPICGSFSLPICLADWLTIFLFIWCLFFYLPFDGFPNQNMEQITR
jgi:hypothetical protein